MSKKNLEDLLNAATEIGKNGIQKNGFLVPFAVIHRDERVDIQMAVTDENKNISAELVDLLKSGLKKLMSDPSVNAVGLCIDMSIQQPPESVSDALYIQLEDRDGTSVVALLPYTRMNDGGLDFGIMQFKQGIPEFFLSEL